MPHFDIVRSSDVERTFRVERIRSEFDCTPDKCRERFVGDIDLPVGWQIGLIVGSSGTGKSTIARELFGDDLVTGFEWTSGAVVDDMPEDASFDDITRTFYAVGFGSVPSWMKPYAVLSNGEKMRVEMARAMLERDFFVFDEFTSVVDRNVAKTMCIAVEKSIRRSPGKRFVAVSCHRDIVEYLQPDWVFDTDEMKCFFPSARGREASSTSGSAVAESGESLRDIII